MSTYTNVRDACLKMVTCEMEPESALAWAVEHVRKGWLLAEAPEKFTWQPFNGLLDMDLLGSWTSLLVFGKEAELRISRSYGATGGQARMIWQTEDGDKGMERISAYLLAGESRSLEYAEFFRPDPESGLLRLEFARYCGVRSA